MQERKLEVTKVISLVKEMAENLKMNIGASCDRTAHARSFF